MVWYGFIGLHDDLTGVVALHSIHENPLNDNYSSQYFDTSEFYHGKLIQERLLIYGFLRLSSFGLSFPSYRFQSRV
jgi:hypothetical protein